MAGQGFASLSRLRKAEVATKGGKACQAKGRGYTFRGQSELAKAASIKGVRARKRKFAMQAAVRLLRAGLTPAQLDSLHLTLDEFLYYGGHEGNKKRLKALLARLEALK